MVDFECLVADIGGFQAMIYNNQIKTEAEMKTIQGKMDNGKVMKAQVGSVSRIDANQEKKKEEIKTGQAEIKAAVSAILQKMNSW
jgi:hypothetical protein